MNAQHFRNNIKFFSNFRGDLEWVSNAESQDFTYNESK